MSGINELIKDRLVEELQKDYSWKYIPTENKEEIIDIHLKLIAEWLVNSTKNYRLGDKP